MSLTLRCKLFCGIFAVVMAAAMPAHAGQIEFTAPPPGQTLKTGDKVTVRWKGTGFPAHAGMYLYVYDTNNQQGLPLSRTELDPNGGALEWTVIGPATACTGAIDNDAYTNCGNDMFMQPVHFMADAFTPNKNADVRNSGPSPTYLPKTYGPGFLIKTGTNDAALSCPLTAQAICANPHFGQQGYKPDAKASYFNRCFMELAKAKFLYDGACLSEQPTKIILKYFGLAGGTREQYAKSPTSLMRQLKVKWPTGVYGVTNGFLPGDKVHVEWDFAEPPIRSAATHVKIQVLCTSYAKRFGPECIRDKPLLKERVPLGDGKHDFVMPQSLLAGEYKVSLIQTDANGKDLLWALPPEAQFQVHPQ